MEKIKLLRNNVALLMAVCLLACTLTAAIPPVINKIYDPFQGHWVVSELSSNSFYGEIIVSGQHASLKTTFGCVGPVLVSKSKYTRSGDVANLGGDSYVKSIRLLSANQLEAQIITFDNEIKTVTFERTCGGNPLNNFPAYLFWP